MTRQISAMWLAVVVALVGCSIVAAEGADPPYPKLGDGRDSGQVRRNSRRWNGQAKSSSKTTSSRRIL
jgi:hypothetical protein